MTSQRLLGRVLLVLFSLSAPPGRRPRSPFTGPGPRGARLSPQLGGAPPSSAAPTRARLARAATLPEPQVRQALLTLERDGLVDASGPRLTMAGLAVAAALRAAGGVAPRVSRASGGRPRTVAGTSLPPRSQGAVGAELRGDGPRGGLGAAISSAA